MEQVGAVLQDDHLFAGNLTDNITLFDDAPDTWRVAASAEKAAIHDEITAMTMGYETLTGDMGSSLSGGQQQRVLLARALYRAPKVLILDEATSHLGPTCEEIVGEATDNLRITRIHVAHRIETIAAADQVFELRDGKIVERRQAGTNRIREGQQREDLEGVSQSALQIEATTVCALPSYYRRHRSGAARSR